MCRNNLFVLSWIVLISVAFVNGNSLPSYQLNGLEFIYNSTNGYQWKWSSNVGHWNFSSSTVNPCLEYWEGVTCNSNCSTNAQSICSVISLNLTNMNLSGTIPSQISTLTELESLEINNNPYLSGSIPTSIGMLCSLTVFMLTSNLLSGVLPTAVGQLSVLQYLQISNNNVDGIIPTQVGKLKKLVSLQLNNNQFSQSIPTELGELTLLTMLSLSTNNLRNNIPTEIGLITDLVCLYK